jgi:hypothetical protein
MKLYGKDELRMGYMRITTDAKDTNMEDILGVPVECQRGSEVSRGTESTKAIYNQSCGRHHNEVHEVGRLQRNVSDYRMAAPNMAEKTWSAH